MSKKRLKKHVHRAMNRRLKGCKIKKKTIEIKDKKSSIETKANSKKEN